MNIFRYLWSLPPRIIHFLKLILNYTIVLNHYVLLWNCTCSWVGPVLQEIPLFLSFLAGSDIVTNCTCVLKVPALSPCSRDEVMVHVFCTVELLGLESSVGSKITKQHTRYREPLEPDQKLALTLRHLTSGSKYSTMKYAWRVPQRGLPSHHRWIHAWNDDLPHHYWGVACNIWQVPPEMKLPP